jgi:2-furoyl-CoA dehydrogenase 2Fe-2S iron sulfur subunit
MTYIKADARHPVEIELNGQRRRGHAPPRMQLCDFLRHELGATGTHVGCEHGICGACTVLLEGRTSRSCMMLAVQADGKRIDTVEGLAKNGELSALQAAFSRHHALQCGFCTAGILMSCAEFLERVSEPDERDVREMLSGHLCRCTGYTGIVSAVLEVAATRQQDKEERHV